MKNPATFAAVIPHLNKKNKAPERSLACLLSHPKPDSVIMLAAHKGQGDPSIPHSTPPDKEGSTLDNLGEMLLSYDGYFQYFLWELPVL